MYLLFLLSPIIFYRSFKKCKAFKASYVVCMQATLCCCLFTLLCIDVSISCWYFYANAMATIRKFLLFSSQFDFKTSTFPGSTFQTTHYCYKPLLVHHKKVAMALLSKQLEIVLKIPFNINVMTSDRVHVRFSCVPMSVLMYTQ